MSAPPPQRQKITRAELFGLYVSQTGLVSRLQEGIARMLVDPTARIGWHGNGVSRQLTLTEARAELVKATGEALRSFDLLMATGLNQLKAQAQAPAPALKAVPPPEKPE